MDKVTIKLEVDRADLRNLYQAFRDLDEETNKALKTEVQQLSSYVAREIQSAASSAPNPQQAMLIAQSVRANKDRIPNITIGGSRIARVARKQSAANPRPRMGQLVFGSEFGTKSTGVGMFKQGGRKFPYWSGTYHGGGRGYWIFPTLRRLQPKITHDYHAIIDRYIRRIW